jgi:hypothetical protein
VRLDSDLLLFHGATEFNTIKDITPSKYSHISYLPLLITVSGKAILEFTCPSVSNI